MGFRSQEILRFSDIGRPHKQNQSLAKIEDRFSKMMLDTQSKLKTLLYRTNVNNIEEFQLCFQTG